MTAKFNIEPTNGLLEKICSHIQKEERSFVVRRIALFATIFAICTLAFAPTLRMLEDDVTHSGFLNFFSLLFSDSLIVTSYWQSFVMSLLESVPTISLALFLAVVLGILESLKYLTHDIKTIIKAKA